MRTRLMLALTAALAIVFGGAGAALATAPVTLDSARVLDQSGNPIAGLYAAGNQAGTPFGDVYPGAGATIGPAMTFGYIAANDIAERSGNQRA